VTRWAVAALFAVSLCAGAGAPVEAPLVRAELEPDKVRVGETAKLRVTVLVPTFFKSPPVYPSFEIADAMTRLPPDSSFPTSENIDGEAWSGIVRDYEIVPLVAGRFALDPGKVVVRYADPDSGETRDAEGSVPRFVLRAVVPTGAETLDPYVGGSSLQLERTLEGEADGLEVGDALVVRVRARLHDQCERYRRASVDLRHADRDLAAEHGAIRDAVLARDADTAQRLVTAHFDATARMLADEMAPGRTGDTPA